MGLGLVLSTVSLVIWLARLELALVLALALALAWDMVRKQESFCRPWLPLCGCSSPYTQTPGASMLTWRAARGGSCGGVRAASMVTQAHLRAIDRPSRRQAGRFHASMACSPGSPHPAQTAPPMPAPSSCTDNPTAMPTPSSRAGNPIAVPAPSSCAGSPAPTPVLGQRRRPHQVGGLEKDSMIVVAGSSRRRGEAYSKLQQPLEEERSDHCEYPLQLCEALAHRCRGAVVRLLRQAGRLWGRSPYARRVPMVYYPVTPGVGGYRERVVCTSPQITSRGLHPQTLSTILSGTVLAAHRAHASLAPGSLALGGRVENGTIKRSPPAYHANPAAERPRYSDAGGDGDQEWGVGVLRFAATPAEA
ncbi:hypothetical protein DFH08DRAFT_828267 [Mycena albidolilacea]|uniref:Neutral ceramidase n=1 Tax=Mycena albidolilacea TaxID=1033008 RepID=A0AAD6YWP2_9AGAR|nr:hypothetical protein DFH08DRAFT_828267 [Mycena albidolilacea]